MLAALVAAYSFALPCAAQDRLDDPKAVYDAAENLRKGTDGDVDLVRALELHEALIAEGYNHSLVRAADIYERQGRYAEAIEAFTQAETLGSAYAAVRLGRGHARGDFGALSRPAEGLAKLADLAGTGDNDLAEFYLADVLAAQDGPAPDPARAIAIYEKLSARGYVFADARLGRVYLDGEFVRRDVDRAIGFFRAAVAGGYDNARIGLSRALIEAGRGPEALQVIDAAVAEGVNGAAALRAEWHRDRSFGDASDREFGAADLGRLAEAGDVSAARRALIYHERRSTRLPDLDLPKVLAGLEAAASTGDRLAMLGLARAYRRLDWLIPDAAERHRKLIDEHGDSFDDRNAVAEQITALYDSDDHNGSRVAAYRLLDAQQGEAFSYGLIRLRSIEQTAFVYVLQNELARLGYDVGRINGFMTQKTLAATLQFCADTGIAGKCRHGPMLYGAGRLIADALAERRETSDEN
ncbi:hypothetical protein RGUI_3101 [Rhodovulum sp. P5]|uniref:tetratricopeptide repeat protein n=1 Tax=Rhodovulum sp. P5 TaxID=1564506 RepID=UPI0009C35BF7|nr:tetratricopeptide repeat protein [Rhodovulum sp. P5]ARE41242.1 hypothetical protein RGUI_3101 [Rhodovulum sp. P5]